MRKQLTKFLKDESGATAIEYSLLAGLIGVALVTVFVNLKDDLFGLIDKVSKALIAAM